MFLRIVSTMAVLAMLPATPVHAADPAGILSCEYPVMATDTAKSLLARYRGAKIDDIYIADSQVRGVRLFPGGDREIDVSFSDDRMTHVQYVMTVDKSAWHGPKGLHLRSPMAEVVAANNGRPFAISGFDWDYGGWINDTHGGPLHDLAGKGCHFGLRLETTAQLPGDEGYEIAGEGVTLTSDDPRVVKARPVVSEMSVTFATPKP